MHRTTIFRILLTASILLSPMMSILAQASGQGRRGGIMQVGLHIDGVLSAPTADFVEFPGVSNCIVPQGDTRFESGSGGGFSLCGVLALKPAIGATLGSRVGGVLKVGLSTTSTTFEADETIGSASDPAGTIHPVVSRYGITVRLSEMRVEPSASFWPSTSVPVLVSLGARLGYVFGGTYDHREDLVAPSGATFRDGSTVRNTGAGDITEVRTLQMGLSLGVAYDIPMSPTLSLRPEIGGLLGLQSPVNGVQWKANEVRLGVSLLYMLPREGSSPLQEE